MAPASQHMISHGIFVLIMKEITQTGLIGWKINWVVMSARTNQITLKTEVVVVDLGASASAPARAAPSLPQLIHIRLRSIRKRKPIHKSVYDI